MSVNPELRRPADRFEKYHGVEIINAMQQLDWQTDPDKRKTFHRDPVARTAIDPLEGIEYKMATDNKYLRTDEIHHPYQIPTHFYVSNKSASWQVIPLLELQRTDDPSRIYRLYGNFDPRMRYQLGDGLRLQFQAWTKATSGGVEEDALIVRTVYGKEQTEFKSRLERLLAVDLR